MKFYNLLNGFIVNKIINPIKKKGFYEWHIALFLFLLPQIIMWIADYLILLNLLIYTTIILALFSPVLAFNKAKSEWESWREKKFLMSTPKVLLEMRIPKDFNKTPKAMEMFFEAIHIKPGESTFIDTKIKGSFRPWWSFEIASFEGEIHFYIWTWKKFKDLIETQIKAQFPKIEIVEVEDYLSGLQVDLDKMGIWGTDFKFEKPDAYPIKTYMDFGLDKNNLKEDATVVDPFANVLEKMSSFGVGEVVVLHIMTQVTKNKNWKKDVEKEIEKIYEERAESYPSLHDPNETIKGMAQLRPQDWDMVNTLKHSIEKNAFDTGIRAVYIAKKDKFNPGKIGVNLVHIFRAYASAEHNYLVGVAHWLAGYDYPWQDFKNMGQDKKRKAVVRALKYRSYFHSPFSFDPMVLTTEELASIYHFPNMHMYSSGIKKESVSANLSAPDNLPV